MKTKSATKSASKIAAKPTKTWSGCFCCGQPTQNAEGFFLPGHDAKVKAEITAKHGGIAGLAIALGMTPAKPFSAAAMKKLEDARAEAIELDAQAKRERAEAAVAKKAKRTKNDARAMAESLDEMAVPSLDAERTERTAKKRARNVA